MLQSIFESQKKAKLRREQEALASSRNPFDAVWAWWNS
jgi:hypothetical protein